MVSRINSLRVKALLRAGTALALGVALTSTTAWASEGHEGVSGFLPDPTSANFQAAAGVPECTRFDVLRRHGSQLIHHDGAHGFGMCGPLSVAFTQ